MRTAATVLLMTLLIPQGSESRQRRQIEEGNLQSVVQQLAITVEQLQAQVSSLQSQLDAQNQHATFMAQFSADHAVGPANGPYVFDQVVHNDGNGYDPTTGIFTAPVAGTYLFMCQIFTDGSGAQHPFVDIEVNDTTIARMAFENSGGDATIDNVREDSDSTTVTVKLQAGDKVWVESEERHSYRYWGGYHTFFSGVLIFADSAM